MVAHPNACMLQGNVLICQVFTAPPPTRSNMARTYRQKPKFVTEYRHRWTGKVMVAREYGYKAWPFGKR